jgi:hypothetical protein
LRPVPNPVRARAASSVDITLHREGVPMTEAEWLTLPDPDPVLRCLPGNAKELRRAPGFRGDTKSLLKRLCKASDRKLRLFACACCRRLWDRMQLPQIRAIVEAAEAYVDRILIARQLCGPET